MVLPLKEVLFMATITVTDKPNILNPNNLSFDERALQLQAQEKAETEARKREKQSPFSRWTQFNNEHTKELMILAIKYPKAHAILYFLVDQMDNYNACICSYKVMQEVLECGQATVARNIKILKDLGFLAILKSGNANVYTINDKVYWKSWGNNRQYSKFPANVVLAMSEQDEDHQISFDKLKSDKIKTVTLKNKD
jgi:hypothetical protein